MIGTVIDMNEVIDELLVVLFSTQAVLFHSDMCRIDQMVSKCSLKKFLVFLHIRNFIVNYW